MLLEYTNGRKSRLFTYVVAFDGGNAPNPYGGVCTLGICKPAIRRAAEKGDIIVGLEPGGTRRIVYCMQVTDKLTWKEYIDLCHGGSDGYPQISKKIPRKETDHGDCIWKHNNEKHESLPSWSRHDSSSYGTDVENGQYVLLGEKFWYFGEGSRGKNYALNIRLPEPMPSPGRGHLSNKNEQYTADFIRVFNDKANNLPTVRPSGIYGKPKNCPETDDAVCSPCRKAERENEDAQEE